MSVSEQKSVLRKSLLQKRDSLTSEEWKRKSDQIISNLYSTQEFKKAKTIHCFVSINERKEVNTHELIKQLLNSDKQLIVPVTNFENNSLDHSVVNSFQDLIPNKWKVLEPKSVNKPQQKPDLVLIPLLASDKKFNRLGYGKGFYDRFLSSTDAVKAGLIFSDFIIDKVPVEEFDEKLDILITEQSVLIRNNRIKQS